MTKSINLKNLSKKKNITIKRMNIKFYKKNINVEIVRKNNQDDSIKKIKKYEDQFLINQIVNDKIKIT
jgi:hypothetical protein